MGSSMGEPRVETERCLNNHIENRDLQRPYLDRCVSSTGSEIPVHVPDAFYRSSVTIRE